MVEQFPFWLRSAFLTTAGSRLIYRHWGYGQLGPSVAPHEFQLRRALTVWLDDHEDDIREAIAEMTSETLSAWRRFRVETNDGG